MAAKTKSKAVRKSDGRRVTPVVMDSSAPRRAAEVDRKTKETQVSIALKLDGSGRGEISTGVPFLDHMLDSFARHGFFDLTVQARGDLAVDQHHTVEDVGLALGQAMR